MPIYRLVLAIHLLTYGQLAAADWPQFRGPTGDGIADATNVPVEWTTTDNVAWKTPVPGEGWSSPVLAGGRLYLTAAVDQQPDDEEPNDDDSTAVSLRALCLDATSGQILWDVEVLRPDPQDAKRVHTKNSRASSTPIVAGDRLYVHFGHMGTAALDLEGNVIWRQQDVTYHPMHGNGGSPVLVDDVLVFSCDAAREPFVVALDRSTGEVRWRTPRDSSARQKFSFSTPLLINVDGAKQIISAGSGFVGAYDPQDGREIWRVGYGDGYSVVPRPVFAHGLLFIATGYNRARLLAINPVGARGDTTDDHIVWTHERGVPLTPSMVVVGDELYFVSDNGVANCLDARTGKPHWSERLGGDFSASPVFGDGRIYFMSEEGAVYVVQAATEFQLLATNDMAERALASPAVTDGAIIVRTESHLWRVGE